SQRDFNPPDLSAVQRTLWTPPTPGTAQCDFVSLYAPVDVPHHRPTGSPALDCLSSATCRPCYPGRSLRQLPLSMPKRNGLPHMTTGSASSIKLRGYMQVHLRYGLLLCRLGTHDPLLPERRSRVLPGCTDNSPGGTLTR
ncbi:MAG: hypothetical protein ABSH41_21215, partial [Syntrophobacteraceae bacterium]